MKTILTAILCLCVCTSLAVAAAPPAGAFDALMKHYDPIRDTLVKDKADGVAAHATAIASIARELQGNLTAQRAGVKPEKVGDLKAALPKIVETANRLAAARGLEQTRAAFAELSAAMIRYRDLIPGSRPVVAYCSMGDRRWMQPNGEIWNPYWGEKMLHCGQIIAK